MLCRKKKDSRRGARNAQAAANGRRQASGFVDSLTVPLISPVFSIPKTRAAETVKIGAKMPRLDAFFALEITFFSLSIAKRILTPPGRVFGRELELQGFFGVFRI